jgi:hypothetical protein
MGVEQPSYKQQFNWNQSRRGVYCYQSIEMGPTIEISCFYAESPAILWQENDNLSCELTWIPNIMHTNVFSCSGPNILITKLMIVKLLMLVYLLSSPIPFLTSIRCKVWKTLIINLPKGFKSDVLNTASLVSNKPVSLLILKWNSDIVLYLYRHKARWKYFE